MEVSLKGTILYKMKSILITKVAPDEIEALVAVSRETFYEAFAESNAPENMEAYLKANLTYDKIGAELANTESFFYIAWQGKEAIAYLKLNTGNAQTEPLGESSLEIERIYVKGAYHGKKVGQMLYEQAVEVANSLHKSLLWLGVWEENLKAIGFYEKNGFKPFGTHLFMMGEEAQTDILMKKDL